MRRRNNQDSYNVVLADSSNAFDRVGHLFIVADGMGAHAAGELASQLAVDLIPHHFLKNLKTLPVEALSRSFTESNAEIFRRGQANPEFRNMGTTASALAIFTEGAVVAHVGDSRVYRLRGQQFEQLTFDHSLVWEMQASGEVNEETIRSGVIPKNVITRSLGPNPSVQVDIEGPFPIRIHDRFLLCSDGLSGQISDEEMGAILQVFEPEQATQLLIDLANLRGGPDNITVLVIEATGGEVETHRSNASGTESVHESGPTGFSSALIAVTIVCFLVAAALLFTGNWPMAIVVAILGSIAIGTGIAQRHNAQPPSVMDGSRYGNGPHRRYLCKPDIKLIEQLNGMIRALREASAENKWNIDWDKIEPLLQKGNRAAQAKDFNQGIRHLGLALIDVMEMMKKKRSVATGDSESVF